MAKPTFTDEFKQGVVQYVLIVLMNLNFLLLNVLTLLTVLFING